MRIKHHQKRVGRSGSGKTYSMIRDALTLADYEDTGICFFAPHPDAADLLLLHLEDRGHIDRVVVDDLADNQKVLMKEYLMRSNHAVKVDEENEQFRDGFLSLVSRRRQMGPLAGSPAIEQNGVAAARVYQSLNTWIPLSMAYLLIDRNYETFEWAKQNVTNQEALRELERIEAMNVNEYVTMVVPAQRYLWGYLNRTHIRARSSRPPTFHLPSFLKDCGNGLPGIYISRGAGSKEAIQINMVTDFQQLVFDAKTNPSRTVRVAFRDEGFNYDMIHTFEVESMNTTRGFNFFTVDAVQQYPADPAIETPFRQNTDTLIFQLRMWDMALKGAQDLALALDEYKVHHKRKSTRQIHQGFRQEERKTKTVRGESTSETVGLKDVPIYDTFIEEQDNYQPGNEQFIWKAQKIMQLGIGECFRQLGNNPPEKVRVPSLPKLCAFDEDMPAEVERILAEIKSRPIYQEPQKWDLPKPVDLNSQSKKKSQSAPKVPTGSASKIGGKKGGRSSTTSAPAGRSRSKT